MKLKTAAQGHSTNTSWSQQDSETGEEASLRKSHKLYIQASACTSLGIMHKQSKEEDWETSERPETCCRQKPHFIHFDYNIFSRGCKKSSGKDTYRLLQSTALSTSVASMRRFSSTYLSARQKIHCTNPKITARDKTLRSIMNSSKDIAKKKKTSLKTIQIFIETCKKETT